MGVSFEDQRCGVRSASSGGPRLSVQYECGEEARAPASRTTMPQLDAASAAAYLGADVEKAWGYALSMQTPASGAPAPAAAAKGNAAGKPAAKGAKAGGLTLSIEPLGSGVLLSIRKA